MRWPWLLAAAVVGAASRASADPVVGSPTKDPNGVLHYPVTSSFQESAPNDVRVLLPSSFGAGQRRFLYALPVEVGTESAFGDPTDVVRLLGVVDSLHLVLVVPAFSQLPWYADHATDPTIRQESYFVDDLVPAIEKLYPETPQNLGPPRRLLLGFSKSGVGAMSLILRHSSMFDAAAAWDAPLHQTDVSGLPGAAAIFGTQANYDGYAIPLALPAHAGEFQGPARLWLGGFSGWHADMIAAHDQMLMLGITHAWMDGPMIPHRWDSGWVSDAIAFLDQAAPALTYVPDAGPDGGSDAGDGGTLHAGQGGAGSSVSSGQAAGGADGAGPIARGERGCGCGLAPERGLAPFTAIASLAALAAARARRARGGATKRSAGRPTSRRASES